MTTALRIVTNQEVWQALRAIVPELPRMTNQAVLRVTQYTALLEWVEATPLPDRPGETYYGKHIYRWSTKPEADALMTALTHQVGVPLTGWQELRVEIRDLHEFRAVEIEGRRLWMREITEKEEEV